MATLLYEWDFTSNTTITDASSVTITDNINNLESQVLLRGTISNSTVSQNEDGIILNNSSEDSGGYCIDLSGLNTTELGGNITLEMVIKNTDLSRNVIYFQTIRDVAGEANNESAFITCKYNSGTRLLLRTDSKSNINNVYTQRKAIPTTNAVTDSTQFYHYIFTISHTTGNSSIKVFINGVEQIEKTNDLVKQLSTTLRQSNLLGTQKNQSGATYLKGTVKYLKIYQGAMTNSEVLDKYNNSEPYFSDITSKTPSEKYERRHTKVNSYFEDNQDKTSFILKGNQLGLSNKNVDYTIHKFVNEEVITVNSGYHYVPLSGKDKFIIFKNGTTYYKVTQTSLVDGSGSVYKYEISTDNGNNYGAAVTGKVFDDSVVDGNVTIGFGGVEFGVSSGSGAICFLGHVLVETDQGKIPIKNITKENTIYGNRVIAVIKVINKYNYMILFKKNSLGLNVPSEDTLVSKNHCIYINNEYIKAIKLVNNNNIIIKRRGHDTIYNLLFNKHYIMVINNMIVETLHPKNIHAQKYLKNL